MNVTLEVTTINAGNRLFSDTVKNLVYLNPNSQTEKIRK